MSETDRLRSIASAIATGAPVSWHDEERRALGQGEIATLKALRGFEELLNAVRHADHDEEPTPPTAIDGAGDLASAPRQWAHLVILGTIGQGSFGTVYRAHDPKLGIDVALKLLAHGAGGRRERADNLLKEAQLLARVRHPNVVRVYGAHEAGDNVGLWMELVQGLTLREILRMYGRFSAQEASIIGRDLCRAMAAVHQAGVLHGDIKAHNVMREAGGRIVLMDFGAGQSMSSTLTDHTSALAGTPVYLSPEVLAGHPRSAASDIYALGVLLYYLVTDTYPVSGKSVDALVSANTRGERRHLRDARPDLPDDFVRAVERAIAADSRERFSSLGQFEDALVRVTSPVHAASVEVAKPAIRPPRPLRRWRAPIAAGVVVLLGAVGAVWMASGRPTPPTGTARESSRESADLPAVVASSASGMYDIEAAFFRASKAGEEQLQPDGRVAPGDELFLKMQSSVPLHVYVVDEDDKGAAFLLFPLRGERLTNPLPAGQSVIVPGATRWQVTSQGEREHFLVFASPEPLDSLEEAFARLPEPRVGMPVDDAPLAKATLERLRGVGGLAPAPAAQNGDAGLARLFTLPLPAEREQTRGLWVRQLTLDNPVR